MKLYVRYIAVIINFFMACLHLYSTIIQVLINNEQGASSETVTFLVYLVVTLLSLALFFPEVRFGLQRTSKENFHEILCITVLTLLCAAGLSLIFRLCGVSYVRDGSIPSVYSAIISVILAPIYEEILCRGVILRLSLNRTKSPGISVAFSTIIYAILHVNIYSQPLYLELINATVLLCLGLSCGISYYKTNNIVYPIGIHILWNFFMTVPNILSWFFDKL